MTENMEFGYDNALIDLLHKEGVLDTPWKPSMEGTVKFVSSPQKVGMRFMKIKEKFPTAVILEVEEEFGYQYVTVKVFPRFKWRDDLGCHKTQLHSDGGESSD
ncbi:MAG: hypothetical protein J6Y78_10830 [Paludibacteraceae bacterium]|nr:hypothetical protein [Paludibacteraceae bacterium]